MIIRDVEDRDAAVVLKFGVDFLSYYPFTFEYDEYELLKVLENVSNTGIFLMAEKDGEVVGTIGGVVSPHPYAPMHLVATEMFLWVDEEHRKSTIGPRLMKAFEERGKQRGCKYMAMTSTINTPNFKKFLTKKGYTEVETSYLKEI